MSYVAAALVVMLLSILIGLFGAWRLMIWMPGRLIDHDRLPPSDEQVGIRDELRRDLEILAQHIGERNLSRRYEQLVEAAEFLERSLGDCGYQVDRQEFVVHGRLVWNVEVQRAGVERAGEILVVGAHYDTVPGSPGANDNGSAVVAALCLARKFARVSTERTLRFVFFVNEEAPYYMTPAMGSLRCAQRCRQEGERVVGMLSLETIGCYCDAARSQHYPLRCFEWLYPTRGNFVAVVGNVRSRRLVRQVTSGLRRSGMPTEGIAAPRWLKDIFRSDHAAFWHCGYAGLMVTDTANFRYSHYHMASDTVDKIDFDLLARLVSGLAATIAELTGARSSAASGW
jgi:hypothetical protein